MLYETGRVVAVEHDGLWVETLKQSACASCAAKAGCGQKLLAGYASSSNMTLIKAMFHGDNEQVWAVGDRVILGVDRHILVLAALISYVLPLALMILAVAAAQVVFNGASDVQAILAALIGLLLGAAAVRAHAHSSVGKHRFQAQVIGRPETPNSVQDIQTPSP